MPATRTDVDVHQVVICGPNLNDQSKGTFHVHAAGCAEARQYGPHKRHGGETPWQVEATSRADVVLDVYGPDAGDFDLDATDPESIRAYAGEFHFAPCCELPGDWEEAAAREKASLPGFEDLPRQQVIAPRSWTVHLAVSADGVALSARYDHVPGQDADHATMTAVFAAEREFGHPGKWRLDLCTENER